MDFWAFGKLVVVLYWLSMWFGLSLVFAVLWAALRFWQKSKATKSKAILAMRSH